LAIPERSFTRGAILERLRATLARGEPVIAAAAGAGIVAKCSEIAGADLIVILCTGYSRMRGIPTTVTLGNATSMTLDIYPQVDNVVERTPIVGGIEATDPTRRRLPGVLQQFRNLGFDGITNFPSVGAIPSWGRARSDVGQGIEREYELIELARQQDLFTIGCGFSAEHAKGLAAAGADVIVARCGLTVGGMTGPTEPQLPLDEAVAHVQAIVESAQAENPEVICLAHGGPFATPDDTDYLYQHTDVQGFFGESSIERIPIEEGVKAEIAALKAQPLRALVRK
jgi:predicted TIM-barrel enzyme